MSKRKGDFPLAGARKAPKLATSGKMSFAEKMMAKMGHVQGQGLGKGGEGIVNPIEVKLRPQGAGVGAVKEKTEQYKQEQKRIAIARGEEFEDSSDEERKARQRRKEIARTARSGNAGSRAGAAQIRRKATYKTVEEITAAAPGLKVPALMLSSIVDATGSHTRLLTSTAGLMTTTTTTMSESPLEKIQKREKLELEAFIEAWHGLQERKIVIEEHQGQYNMQAAQQDEDVLKLQSVIDAVASLELDSGIQDLNLDARLDQIFTRIQTLQRDHQHEIDHCRLADAAVAVLHHPFAQAIDAWEPLDKPSYLADHLQLIRPILGLTADDALALSAADDPDKSHRPAKGTSPYESLMYTLWLPKLRTVVTTWDVHDAQPMLDVVAAWKDLLPPFIFYNLIEQLIMQKLMMHLQAWNPKKHRRKHREAELPHVWLFPWLPLLPAHHLDPQSQTGLLRDVKRKFRTMLETWDLSQGAIPGLNEWRALLGNEIDYLLVRHLLPRLANYLQATFVIDPTGQELEPLEHVLAWTVCLKPEIMSRLLISEFFPKWFDTLHVWLLSNGDPEEILGWHKWWTQQLPEDISKLDDVQRQWNSGIRHIMDAFAMQDRGEDLSLLKSPQAQAPVTNTNDNAIKADITPQDMPAIRPRDEEVTFKDTVESWCAEHDLTLVPLREPHAGTGSPLFRITASATGKGGVVVYFRDDIVWAQRRGQKDDFDAFGLEESLLLRAEGR